MQTVASEVMVPLAGGTINQTVQSVVNQAGSKSGVFQNTLKAKIANSKETPETETTVTDTTSDSVDAALVLGFSALPGMLPLTPVTNAETDQLTAVSNEVTELPGGNIQQAITAVIPEDSKVNLPFVDLMINQKVASETLVTVPNAESKAADEQLMAANLTVSNPGLEAVKMTDVSAIGQMSAVSVGELNQPPVSNQVVFTASVISSDNSQGNAQAVNGADPKGSTKDTVSVAAAPGVSPEVGVPKNSLETVPGILETAKAVEQDLSVFQESAAQVDAKITPQVAVLSMVVKQDKNQNQNQPSSSELPVSDQTDQSTTLVDKQAAIKSQSSINRQETFPTVLPAETPNNPETTLASGDSKTAQSTMQPLEIKGTNDQLVMGESSDTKEGSGTKTDATSDYALLFKLQQTAQGNILTKQAANPQENVKNVIERLELMMKDNLAQAKMVLKPDHLGQMTIHMDVQDGVLNAKFVVDNQQAKAMLETNLTVFRQQLEQSGVRVEKVEVTINQSGNDGSQFFNQSQYRPPGQGNYQQSGFGYYSRQENYGSDDFDYLPEKVPLIAANSNSLGSDGVNYVV